MLSCSINHELDRGLEAHSITVPSLMVSTHSPRIARAHRASNVPLSHLKKKKAILVTLLASIAVSTYFQHTFDRQPKRTSILTGQKRIEELMEGHPGTFKEQFGMNKHVFHTLLQFLCRRCQLRNNRHISAAEQLSIFCHFAVQGLSNRQLQHLFQHSGETISK